VIDRRDACPTTARKTAPIWRNQAPIAVLEN